MLTTHTNIHTYIYMDDRGLPYLSYKLTTEPKGSGELKIRVSWNPCMKFQNPACMVHKM